jgi:DNA-binding Lrp family transcriptional regulator
MHLPFANSVWLVTAKSLDVYALVKLLLEKGRRPYGVVAREIGMSASEYHAAVHRLGMAGLVDPETRSVRRRPAEDFLLHGLRYVFPAVRGTMHRGMPTSFAAPPLVSVISSEGDAIPVWASAEGSRRGYAIEPLHPSAPKAAARDPQFYEWLALIDAIREGRPRQSKLAMQEVGRRLDHL